MTLLQKAKPEMAYLKLGIYGEAGSGKTHTSSKVAIGLHKHIKDKKAISFIDTETGSDFVLPMFKEEKIELLVAKTRAFADLLTVVGEAEKSSSILIVDSITHFWNELLISYQKKHNISRITLRHWIPLKQTWREFTDLFVNSKLHIIMAGRSAYIWDDVEDEEGVKELKKTGTKMRAETEMGYEPSLLVEMETVRTSPRTGAEWIHRAWVIKDRFDMIDGDHFDNPEFKSFLPHIKSLNLGGKHRAIDQERNSQEMFKDDNTGEARFKRLKILTEKVQNAVYRAFPGSTKQDKLGRLDLLKKAFDTDSWTAISTMRYEDLEVGLKIIESEIRKEAK
ncbi:MAG: AAA family ATPase [Candidatus Bathyarchaeia archaeon]